MGNILSHVVTLFIGLVIGILFKDLFLTMIGKLNKKNP